MSPDAQILLHKRHPLPGSDPDLFVDKINAVDGLGDRMLHLQPGVHLDEMELSVLMEELDGSCAGVGHRRDRIRAFGADFAAGSFIDARARCFLEQLLVAALK